MLFLEIRLHFYKDIKPSRSSENSCSKAAWETDAFSKASLRVYNDLQEAVEKPSV